MAMERSTSHVAAGGMDASQMPVGSAEQIVKVGRFAAGV